MPLPFLKVRFFHSFWDYGLAAGYLLCIRTLGGLLKLGRILMVDFRAHNPAGVGSIPAAPTEFLWV